MVAKELTAQLAAFSHGRVPRDLRRKQVLSEAFDGIWRTAQAKRIPLRTAAFVAACERVLQARALRGLYP